MFLSSWWRRFDMLGLHNSRLDTNWHPHPRLHCFSKKFNFLGSDFLCCHHSGPNEETLILFDDLQPEKLKALTQRFAAQYLVDLKFQVSFLHRPVRAQSQRYHENENAQYHHHDGAAHNAESFFSRGTNSKQQIDGSTGQNDCGEVG